MPAINLKAAIQDATAPQTAAANKVAQDAVRQDLKASQEQLNTLEVAREELLLAGADSALDAHDSKISDVRRQVERLEARQQALIAQHDKLVDAEQKAAAREVLAKAETGRQRGLAIIKEYDAMARKIAPLVKELTEIHEGIRDANRIAETAGIPGERVALPHHEFCEESQMTPGRYEKAYPFADRREAEAYNRYIPGVFVRGQQATDLTKKDVLVLPDAFNDRKNLWPNEVKPS